MWKDGRQRRGVVGSSGRRGPPVMGSSSRASNTACRTPSFSTHHPRPGSTPATTAIQRLLRPWEKVRVTICAGSGGWGGGFGRQDLRGWQMNAASCPLLRLRIGLAWQLAGSLRQCLQLHLHMHLRLCLDFQRPHLLSHLHLHPHPLQHPHPLPLPLPLPLPRSSNRRTR